VSADAVTVPGVSLRHKEGIANADGVASRSARAQLVGVGPSSPPRMTTARRSAVLAFIPLDPAAATPIRHQVYARLRELIVGGHIARDTKLPSSRALATDLRVSRSTVVAAFEQLAAEGYVTSRTGAGSFVASVLPDDMFRAQRTIARPQPVVRGERPISAEGRFLSATPVSWMASPSTSRAFALGMPALDAFPYGVWRRLMAKRWRRPGVALTGYGESAGLKALRREVADYLVTARGVRCDADQILVVAGSQQVLDIAARVLLDPGDCAWLEEPGYLGARVAFMGAGARIAPVPVDDSGLDVAAGESIAPRPRLIYVTPSHHFPLGATMTLSRRMELLAFASRAGSWVIEDDYDSEFRYAGRPLPALQGIDDESRVIYMGTFSKVLLPGLRLGYMLVPPDLMESFFAARVLGGLHASLPDQAVVADFIAEGHLMRHLRRMRELYEERRDVLMSALQSDADDLVDVTAPDAGMHAVAFLRSPVSDDAARAAASAVGVDTRTLSAFHLGRVPRQALLLGFAGIRPPLIRRASRQLAGALRSMPPGKPQR
jgi:GntR family transcriptional regulator/MocR family aminotransferase